MRRCVGRGTGATTASLAAVVLTVTGSVVACQPRVVRVCREQSESKSYKRAVVDCERAFVETKDPGAGAAAVRALYSLRRYDEFLAWEDRLRGTEAEADFWQRAGYVYWLRGDPQAAKQAYESEVDLRREALDHQGAARGAHQLYLLAWESSQFRQALDHARTTHEEARAAQDDAMQSLALHALATLFFEVGDLSGAQRALDASAELASSETAPVPERLVQQGLIRFHQGRPAMARDLFQRALEVGSESQQSRFYRALYLDLASTELRLGEIEAAGEHLKSAARYLEGDGSEPTSLLYYQAQLDRRQQRHDQAMEALDTALDHEPTPDWRWRLEYERGLNQESLGRWEGAQSAYEASIQVLERVRRSLGLDGFKSWHLDEKRKPYEAMFRLQAEAAQPREAVATMERAKARTFLDSFARSTTTEGAAASRILDAAGDRLDALQTLLPAMIDSPAAALRPVDQLVAALGKRHVLSYFAAGEELWLVRLEGEEMRLLRLDGSREDTDRDVDRFLAHPEDREIASRLGRRLLPAGVLPEPGATLYLVTDDALGHLPFAALRHQGRFLVEDYDLAYVPSVGALVALLEASQDRSPGHRTAPIVLGDSQQDLPAAAREAREVARRLRVEPYLAGEVTRERLLAASDARVLHIATHTGLGPRGPWLSLADGEVSAALVLERRVAPGLVVLASCASAARPDRSKGMWGSLGAAFLAAGSEAVLASLWSIEDQAARDFVLRFYREGGADSPTRALARTQRAFIAARTPPSQWAPFVAFGLDSNR